MTLYHLRELNFLRRNFLEYKSRKTEEKNCLNYQKKLNEQELRALEKDEEFLNSNSLSIVLKVLLKFFLFMFGSMTAVCDFLFFITSSSTVILGWSFVVIAILSSITINSISIYTRTKKIKQVHTLEEIKEEKKRLTQELQQIREHIGKVQEELIELDKSINNIISIMEHEQKSFPPFLENAEKELDEPFQDNQNILKLMRKIN